MKFLNFGFILCIQSLLSCFGNELPAKSCHDLYINHGIKTSGNYFITPDSSSPNLRLEVYCDINTTRKGDEILTIVHHDSEIPVYVQGKEAPGSYSRDIKYKVDNISAIYSLIDSSTFCQQYIQWSCKGSAIDFWYPSETDSWWVGRNWKNQFYWGSAETDSMSCACHPHCFPTHRNNTCNCDSNYKLQWLYDEGILTDKSRLPVLQLRFGDTGEGNEAGQHTLGPLICSNIQHEDVFMGTFEAPVSITSPGYPKRYPYPFKRYHWNFTMERDIFYELIFNDFDLVHWGNYDSLEECVNVLIVKVYRDRKLMTEILRKSVGQPYYISDGRIDGLSITLITCHQMNKDTRRRGFMATLRRSECGSCQDGGNIIICNKNCAIIASENYPYPSEAKQLKTGFHRRSWLLKANPGQSQKVKLQFNDFDLKSSIGERNCSSKNGAVLRIFDVHKDEKILRGSFCDVNVPPTIYSLGDTLLLEYETWLWKAGNGRGFHALFRSISVDELPKDGKEDEINAAAGKPTKQSTVEDGGHSFFAVDESPETCSSTVFQLEPWWRVDLQKVFKISSVKIIAKKQNLRLKLTKWPKGKYGLPMPVSGCPTSDEKFLWQEGLRRHPIDYGTVKDNKLEFWSEGIMLKGGYDNDKGALKHFCLKEFEDSLDNSDRPEWPLGSYCVYQVGNKCPEGFQNGHITFIDRETCFGQYQNVYGPTSQERGSSFRKSCNNEKEGNLPHGNYTSHNTTYWFCCRNDGNPDIPIKLPNDMPFYLLQHGEVCQKVEGMTLLSQYFHFNTENKRTSAEINKIMKKPYPEVDSILYDKGLTLHYCYYDIMNSLRGSQVLVDKTGMTISYSRYHDHAHMEIPHVAMDKFQLSYVCSEYRTEMIETHEIWLKCQNGTTGQYLTIFLHNRYDKLELCDVQVFGTEECGQPLGLASGEIFDSQISSSSYHDASSQNSAKPRLNIKDNGWCASVSDDKKYLQIDLLMSTTITAVVLQDVVQHGKKFYVSKFYLHFSSDGKKWDSDEEPIGQNKIYECVQRRLKKQASDNTKNLAIRFNLLKARIARYIRVTVVAYEGRPCLRMEVIGCRSRKDCYFEESDKKGVIKSSNYPYYYGQDKLCWWVIKPPKGYNIWLEFNVLDLAKPEDIGLSGSCQDLITVHHQSGYNESYSSSSNRNSFSKLMISDGALRLSLKSCFRSSYTNCQGFFATYKLSDCSGCGYGEEGLQLCYHKCGYLYSKNYPMAYSKNSMMRWKIEVHPSQYIQLYFYEFDLNEERCDLDYIDIYDGDLSLNYYVGRYSSCNKPPHKLLSSFNKLHLVFSAQSLNFLSRGFLLKYDSMKFDLPDILIEAIQTGSNLCPQNWILYNENCYKLFRNFQDLKWYDAESSCKNEAHNSHLVSILDRNEMNVLQYLLTTTWNASQTNIYIGLTDEATEGAYRWSDGNPMSYSDWSISKDQPDGGQFEDCSMLHIDSLHSTDHWFDIPCSLGKQDYNETYTRKQVLPVINKYICKFSVAGNDSFINSSINYRNVNNTEILEFDTSELFLCKTGEVISINSVCDEKSDCIDESDEIFCRNKSLALGSFFTCENEEVIPISFVCDFKFDCNDNSDEQFCEHPKCQVDEFKCKNDRCISKKKKCDLINDCIDESDEKNCAGQCYKNNTFQCNFGTCIPKYAFKDGYRDCPGIYGEDEPFKLQQYDESIPLLEFPNSCSDIPSTNYLQGLKEHFIVPRIKNDKAVILPFIVECQGHHETNINLTASRNDDHSKNNKFILNSSTIVHHDSENKVNIAPNFGNVGRIYGRKVIYHKASIKQIRTLINYSAYCRQVLQWESKQKGKLELCFYSNGTIELSIEHNSCKKRCDEENCSIIEPFILERNAFFIILEVKDSPITQVSSQAINGNYILGSLMIGPLVCFGRNNEIGEDNEESNVLHESLKCQNGHVVSADVKCIYEFDKYGFQKGCRDVTHLRYCENFTCPENYIKCSNSYCIPIRYLCDGKVHCPNYEDENSCANYTCPGLFKCQNKMNCIPLHQVCDGERQCEDGNDELFCDFTCPAECQCHGFHVSCVSLTLTSIDFEGLKFVRKLNVSHNNINESGLQFPSPSYLLELDLKYNEISLISTNTFQGLFNLLILDLRHNNIASLSEKSFYYLKNLHTLLLEGNHKLQTIAPGAFKGVKLLQSLNLTDMDITRLQSGTFIGLESVHELSLKRSNLKIIEDGAFTGLTALKKLDITGNQIGYLSGDVFKELTMINHLSSDSFQFCCIISSKVPFERCTPSADEISSCEDLMRNFVQRIFLWILGCLAFLGNLFVILWRLRTKDSNKISASLIISLGCADFFMGLYLIIIACVDVYYRGNYIENSSIWKRSILCKISGFLSTMSAEASVFTLSLITIDRFICLSFPLSMRRWSVNKTRIFITISWILAFFFAMIPFIFPKYFYDEFYSRSGVCLALHITNQKPAGWEYSVGLFFGVNLFAFLIILFSYIHMYYAVQKSYKATNTASRKATESHIGQQMALIVLSNFCCWMPIIIIGLMALSGIDIPGEIYSWIAVFILPLNSAVNPILYTLSSVQFRSSVQKWICTCFQDAPQTSSYHFTRNHSVSRNFDHNQIPKLQNGHIGGLIRSYKPPPGYCTLLHFLRNTNKLSACGGMVTLVDVMNISIEICRTLKDLHCTGYALGGLDMDMVFISENDDKPLRVYLPDINAYKTCNGNINELNVDTAKDIEDYGNLVRKMLRVYHLHWK